MAPANVAVAPWQVTHQLRHAVLDGLVQQVQLSLVLLVGQAVAGWDLCKHKRHSWQGRQAVDQVLLAGGGQVLSTGTCRYTTHMEQKSWDDGLLRGGA